MKKLQYGTKTVNDPTLHLWTIYNFFTTRKRHLPQVSASPNFYLTSQFCTYNHTNMRDLFADPAVQTYYISNLE